MEQLFYNISQILGTTIIHSLWQGLLIYGALQLIFTVVLGLSAQKKHNIAMLGLFSMVAWFGYTFYTEFNNYNWNPVVSNYNLSDSLTLSLYNTYAATPVHQTTFEAYKAEFFNAIKAYLPYIAILYTAGLIINLFKLGASWNKIRLIKKALTPNLALQAQVNDLSRKLGMRKTVNLNFSTRVDVPCVIGYIKPILLLPVTITTQLNADEVEAILMHELSHIQSNDYLLNVIQQVITVLLFFNPFVLLINRIISTERENRCDDLVVQTTGDPLIYAQALLKLEENRHSNLNLALAATGKKYHLLTRIERIMKNQKPTGNFKHIILAIAITAGSIGSISWLNPEIKDGKIILKRTAAKVLDQTSEEPLFEKEAPKTTAPKSKNHFTIVADDTTRLTQLADTGKKKSTIKIIMEDENGNKKEYTSIKDMPADARKELLNENIINQLRADNARSNYLSHINLELKKLNEKLKDNKLKNNKELKKQIEKLQKRSYDLKKRISINEPYNKWMDSIPVGYDGFDWYKYINANKSADLGKMYSSPEWQKNIADITKASIDFSKNFNESEDSKKALGELMNQSIKFSNDFLNSPEWKNYQKELIKQDLAELRKMDQELTEKQSGTMTAKDIQTRLKEAEYVMSPKEVREQIKLSPESKKRVKDMEDRLKASEYMATPKELRGRIKLSPESKKYAAEMEKNMKVVNDAIQGQVDEAIRKEIEEERKKAEEKLNKTEKQ